MQDKTRQDKTRQDPVTSDEFMDLRSRAEAAMLEKAIDSPDVSTLPTQELQALVHELQVHQIELEMQNDELKRVQLALEGARDKYQDLYDSVPVGHFTLTHKGIIKEVNRTGTFLLGMPRPKLINMRFGHFVASESYGQWYRHIIAALGHEAKQSCVLALKREDGSSFYARLESVQQVAPVELRKANGGTLVVHMAVTDITESKRIEEALLASEKRFRRMFESHSAIMLLIEPVTGRILDANRAAERFYGYTMSRLRSMSIEEINILPPDEIQRERNLALKEQRNYFIFPHRLADGKVRTVEVHSTPIEQKGKNILFSIIHDITERKRIEAALRASEQRWQFALEGARDGVWDWNAQTNEVFFSSQWKAMLGYEEHEIGNTLDEWDKRLHPDDKESCYGDIERHFSGEMPFYQNEHRVLCKDGNYKWILDRGKVMEWMDDGKPLRVIGTHTDITDRKRTEEALRESEQRYRAVFDNAAVGIDTLDRHGRITAVNPALSNMLGYTEDELKRLTFNEITHPDDRQISKQNLETLMAGHVDSYRLEKRYLRKGGEIVWGDISTSSIKDAKGNHTGTVGVISDITESKLLQAQLFQSQKLEALGTLVGGIAHDFNNMLQIMMGYCDLLLSDKQKGEPGYDDLQTIIETGKGGAELVKKLLAFGQQGQIFPVPLELNHKISQLTTLISHTLPHVVQVDLELVDGPTTIRADHGQIDQLVMNLAINASEAMPIGGRLNIATATICLDDEYCRTHHGSKPGGYVMLTVSDTGRGMDQEILAKVFDPFFSTKERGSIRGTGLGLSVVKGIVQQQGGHVTCESEPGKGTTVKVYFPVVEAPLITTKTVLKTVQSEGAETILVVEDNIPVAELERKVLTNAGYEVIVATNGQEALDIYQTRKEEISLVILDLLMPEMSGRDCLMELLKIDPSVKVLIASGYAPEDELLRDISPLVKGFLHKPFAISTLPADVRSVLDSD